MVKIPFYPNTPDDTHCYQAALKMVLQHFLPNRNFSYEQLDEITAHLPGLSTWPTKGMLELRKLGFDIVVIEGFDPEAFVKRGGDYLTEQYGSEVGDWAINNSDIPQEQELYSEFIKHKLHQIRLPEISEIKSYIEKGYLVICNVNSSALNEKTGYVGHSVVIFDYDNAGLTLHDPGLPPLENRKISNDLFMKAWAYPSEVSKNLMAFKLGAPNQ